MDGGFIVASDQVGIGQCSIPTLAKPSCKSASAGSSFVTGLRSLSQNRTLIPARPPPPS